MCEMNALKMGVMTTIGAAALTAGAIAGAVIVSGMGIAAASVALIVASVALGIFTLFAATNLIIGHTDLKDEKACYFFGFMKDTLTAISLLFKSCCCCKK